jgi:hypothetical protein
VWRVAASITRGEQRGVPHENQPVSVSTRAVSVVRSAHAFPAPEKWPSSYCGWTFTVGGTHARPLTHPSSSGVISVTSLVCCEKMKKISSTENSMGSSAREEQVLIFFGSLGKVQ